MSVLLMMLYILVQNNTSVTGDTNKEIQVVEDRIQNDDTEDRIPYNDMENRIQNNDTEDRIQNNYTEGNELNFPYFIKDSANNLLNEASIDNDEVISSEYFSQFDEILLENSNNSHYTFSHSSTINNDTRQGLLTVSSSSILPFIQAA